MTNLLQKLTHITLCLSLALFADCAPDNQRSITNKLTFKTIYSGKYMPKHRPNATPVSVTVIHVSHHGKAVSYYDTLRQHALQQPVLKDGSREVILFVDKSNPINQTSSPEDVIEKLFPNVIATFHRYQRNPSFEVFDLGISSLAQAVWMEDVLMIDYILKHNKKLPLDQPPPNWSRTLLQHVVTHDWHPFGAMLADKFLKAGANADAGTPLLIALNANNVEAVSTLLNHGANPFISDHQPIRGDDSSSWSLIKRAQNNAKSDAHCDCSKPSTHQTACTAAQHLASAIISGDEAFAKNLLNKANINIDVPPGCYQGTHLQLAIQYNRVQLAQALVNAGANPNKGALVRLALNYRNFEILKILLDAGGDPSQAEILAATVDAEATTFLTYFADKRQSAFKAQVCSGIQVAIHNGNLPILKRIVELNGGELPRYCDQCATPLLHTWVDGIADKNMFDFLLDKKVNVNAQDSCNQATALHIGLHLQEGELPSDKVEALKLLLTAGANPDLADDTGHTARQLGVQSDEPTIRKMFQK